ncbi:hypothetical protein pEaSNUABM54_00076 [Erwinia phage pEa_SNUABM_54]|nr:hypothetical protein pEaSNUABM54_00076 [Erwinia phage pEa_SNUABM_54]
MSEVLDNDGILAFTQKTRMRVVTKLMGSQVGDDKGDPTPDDPKVVGAINQTLDSMDRQALVLKRLQQDKKRGDDDRSAAVLIAQLNQHTGKTGNPFMRSTEEGVIVDVATMDPEAQVALLPEHNLRPGEDFIGIEDDSYDKFLERLENE